MNDPTLQARCEDRTIHLAFNCHPLHFTTVPWPGLFTATGVVISQQHSGSEGSSLSLVLTSKTPLLSFVKGGVPTESGRWDGLATMGVRSKGGRRERKPLIAPFKVITTPVFYNEKPWAMCKVHGLPWLDPKSLAVANYDPRHQLYVASIDPLKIKYDWKGALYDHRHGAAKDDDMPDGLQYATVDSSTGNQGFVRARYMLKLDPEVSKSLRVASDHALQRLTPAKKPKITKQGFASTETPDREFYVKEEGGEGAPVFDEHGAVVGIVVMNSLIDNVMLMLPWKDIELEAKNYISGYALVGPTGNGQGGGSGGGAGDSRASASGAGQGASSGRSKPPSSSKSSSSKAGGSSSSTGSGYGSGYTQASGHYPNPGFDGGQAGGAPFTQGTKKPPKKGSGGYLPSR